MDGRDQGRRDGGSVVRRELRVWIPSNRTYADGRPKAMDGLNEIIDANRSGYQVGAALERENLEWCYFFIKRAMGQQHWAAMQEKEQAVPAEVYITFVEANQRRDVSNIYGGGCKYVLDALSRARYDKHGNVTKLGAAAIYDDSVRWLKRCIPRVRVNKEKPGIEITVYRED